MYSDPYICIYLTIGVREQFFFFFFFLGGGGDGAGESGIVLWAPQKEHILIM